jgi:hydrophobe/amphiphile efflux-3 (HAE3) family protein
MTGLIIKYRIAIITLSLLLSVTGLALIPGIKTDPDIRNYVPRDMVSRLNTDSIEAQFGTQDMLLILLKDSLIITAENLTRLKSIEEALSGIAGIESTISPFTTKSVRSTEGSMIVEPAVAIIPSTDAERRSLAVRLRDNPMVNGIVVSDDLTMAALIVRTGNGTTEEAILESIDSVLTMHPGRAQIFRGGLPYIRKAIMTDVKRDGIILVPLAIVIMLIFLRLVFREMRGVILPFAMVVMSVAFATALLPLTGWKMSVITLLLPVMLIAVANDYGIHMIARYQEIVAGENITDMKLISVKLIRALRKPILFTGLTTVAGLLGLLMHSIKPARQFGVLTSAGIAIAVILTLVMLPAWLSLLSPPGKGKRRIIKSKSRLDRLLAKSAVLVTRHPGRIILISLAITLLFSFGIFRLKVESNQEMFFPEKHPVRVASALINSHFGGSQAVSVMVKGDIMDPELLATLDKWKSDLESIDGVGHVLSFSQIIREMTKGLFDPGEEGYNRIPDSRFAVAQLIEIYNMNGDRSDFERMVNYDYSLTHLMIRLNNPQSDVVASVTERVEQLSERDGITVTQGGYATIMADFSASIVRGQISSLLFAAVVVALLLTIIFRSVTGGVISVIPVLMSVIFLLGFMGFTAIPLDPATALLSSLMIGVGVDYTIHFIWRYIEEMKDSGPEESVYLALVTTGRGIVFNAMSVITGFSVLLFSGFTSIRFFGYLVLISIGVCMVSALLLVPAIMLRFRPLFAEKAEDKNIVVTGGTPELKKMAR